MLRQHLHLHIPRSRRIELQGVRDDSVSIALLHCREVRGSHLAERRAIIRCPHLEPPGIENPVALGYTRVERHLTERRRLPQVDDGIEVRPAESDPLSALEVRRFPLHSIHQRGAASEGVACVRLLQQPDGARRGSAERKVAGSHVAHHHLARHGVGMGIAEANGSIAQPGISIDGYRTLIGQRRCAGLAAVERIVDARIIDGREPCLHTALVRAGAEVGMHIIEMARIVVLHLVVHLHHAERALREVGIILRAALRPLNFRQSREARQGHIFNLAIGGHILRPHVGLHADDVFPQVVAKHLVRDGLIAIDTVQGQIAADGIRLCRSVERLIIVEVEIRVRRHDDIVVLLGGLNTSRLATPRHDGSPIGKSAFERLVPADHLASELRKVGLRMADDVALQTFLGRMPVARLKALSLYALLAFRTLLPRRLRTLIAADVNILRRENRCHLVEHIVDEAQRLVVSGAKHIVAHAPDAPHLIRPPRTAQFWISRQGSEHMARHVNFGDDGDISLSGILHDVATLLLRVEAAVGDPVIDSAVMPNDGLAALCPHLRQPGIFLDFQSPALVVRQVPVETVDVVEGEHVNETANAVRRNVVARHVKVRAAIAEARRIGDADGRHRHLLHRIGFLRAAHADLVRQCLPQRLHAIECAGIAAAADADARSIHAEAVALSVVRSPIAEGDKVGCGRLPYHIQPHPRALFDVLLQEARVALQALSLSRHDDGLRIDDERLCPGGSLHRLRAWHDVEISSLRRRAETTNGKGTRKKNTKNVFSHSIYMVYRVLVGSIN